MKRTGLPDPTEAIGRTGGATPTFCPANAEIHLLPFEADSAALRDCERRVV